MLGGISDTSNSTTPSPLYLPSSANSASSGSLRLPRFTEVFRKRIAPVQAGLSQSLPGRTEGTNVHHRLVVKRKTIGKRMAAKLKDIRQQLRSRMHDTIRDTGKWLRSVVRGFFQYHAIPAMSRNCERFARMCYDCGCTSFDGAVSGPVGAAPALTRNSLCFYPMSRFNILT